MATTKGSLISPQQTFSWLSQLLVNIKSISFGDDLKYVSCNSVSFGLFLTVLVIFLSDILFVSCPHRSDPGSAQLPAFFNHVNNLKNSFIIVHIATKTLNLMAVTPALPLAGEGAYAFPVVQAKIRGKMPLPLPRGRLGGGCRTFACSTDFISCTFLTA
ncbi:hypothetical protein [Methylovulum psychrotolerans]|uniref:hypothetical protein n=1 Tax=Methylovulum psychrotolerans TaxID=1704499 RepID=UPI0012F92A95|nr:hypothetical protein [Methylovulum psychrotolerans]